MRRTFPDLPVEPTEPAPLFRSIEGQHAPRANPEPCLFLFSSLHFLISFYYKTYHMLEEMILISEGFLWHRLRENFSRRLFDPPGKSLYAKGAVKK
jgi:hypothetical protein